MQPCSSLKDTIDQLAEDGVRRRQFIKAKNRVMNASGALVRRALGWQPDLSEAERAKIAKNAQKILASNDHDALPSELGRIAKLLVLDIGTSRQMAKPALDHIESIEKQMRAAARALPVWPWAKAVKGLSDLGLAIIVAEAGDLGKYDSHSKLWKRLGLAPYTKNGVTRAYSQWRMKGGLKDEDWINAGYSPRRRASIFSQVGTQIIGRMGHGYRPYVGEDIEANTDLSYYERLFVQRLRYLGERDPDEMRRDNTKEGKESYSLHAYSDALRYTEKRLLKHLWQAWRREGATKNVPHEGRVADVSSASDPIYAKVA